MTLTVRAVNTGCVIGFHKPALTYMRGWGASMDDVPLIMFVIEGGGAQIIVDTGGDVARAWEHHGFGWNRAGDTEVTHIPAGLYTDLIQYEASFTRSRVWTARSSRATTSGYSDDAYSLRNGPSTAINDRRV
jgi:hypothetical protein